MKVACSVLCLLCAFGFVSTTDAETIAFDITATVDYVYDPLGLSLGVEVGDVLTSVLQYDLTVPDDEPDPYTGWYYSMPPGDTFINVNKDGASFFETTIQSGCTVVNIEDWDFVNFFGDGDTTPSLMAHADLIWFEVNLGDTDGTAFSDDSLPTSFNLADFEEATLILTAQSADDLYFQDVYAIDATITRITPVPESSVFVLLAMGLLGLPAVTRGRRG